MLNLSQVKDVAAAAAAVRVLRRLRRLRRDAVPQAAEPALRRPRADRQRHRLLVDLRRQPADDALDDERATGRGPAWSNSLFEDNAEFGLGMRLAARQAGRVRPRAARPARAPRSATSWSQALLDADQSTRPGIEAQREPGRGAQASGCAGSTTPAARELLEPWPTRWCSKSVWIVGGDGWAYDIGFGGLDHVLASGRNVNVLVLDTEVYSNTGGQMSKATPRGAVAKFAAGGKPTAKKDLALMAMTYGNVYVARVAMGANDAQTLKAFREAEAYRGPVADHRLQPLHRPRLRHAPRHGAAEGGGRSRATGRCSATTRALAAEGKNPLAARLEGRRACRSRSTSTTRPATRMLAHSDPETAAAAARAGPGGRQRALAALRAAGPRCRAGRRRTGGDDHDRPHRRRYLGLTLHEPAGVPRPSPLCEDVDNIRRLEDAGAAAVVLPSLFEEQITLESHDLDHYLDARHRELRRGADATSPTWTSYNLGPDALPRAHPPGQGRASASRSSAA